MPATDFSSKSRVRSRARCVVTKGLDRSYLRSVPARAKGAPAQAQDASGEDGRDLAAALLGGVLVALRRVQTLLLGHGGSLDQFAHRFDDAAGGNPVGPVVLLLPAAAALRLRHSTAHGRSHRIGIHDHPPGYVPRGASNGLDQRALGAQEPLLVGIENGHQGHLGEVQALPQQVDPDQDVEFAQAQPADDGHALQRVDV